MSHYLGMIEPVYRMVDTTSTGSYRPPRTAYTPPAGTAVVQGPDSGQMYGGVPTPVLGPAAPSPLPGPIQINSGQAGGNPSESSPSHLITQTSNGYSLSIAGHTFQVPKRSLVIGGTIAGSLLLTYALIKLLKG